MSLAMHLRNSSPIRSIHHHTASSRCRAMPIVRVPHKKSASRNRHGRKFVPERLHGKRNESRENAGKREQIKCNNNNQQPEKRRVKDGMRARTIEPCYVNDITRAQVTTTTITR